MYTAAPREGQDHDTLLPDTGAFVTALVIAALTAAAPQLAAAQAAPPCTTIEDDAERLACYDRALRTPPPSAPAPAARAAGESAPAAAPAAPPSPATAAEPRSERRVRESAAPAAPAAPVAGDNAVEDDDRIIPIVIVGVGGRPGREMIFTAQDGATWVQSDTQRLGHLPDPPFEAELKPGAMGSYFLVPKQQGRAIRVRNATR